MIFVLHKCVVCLHVNVKLKPMEQSNIFEVQKETSLLKKFSEIHNSIYANDGLWAQQALNEMLKVLFIKVLGSYS